MDFFELERERDRTRNALREIQELAEALLHFENLSDQKEMLRKIAMLAKGNKNHPYSYQET